MNCNPKSLIEAAQLADTYCVNHTVYSSKSYKSAMCVAMCVEVKQIGKTVTNEHFVKSGTDNTCFACRQGKHYKKQCIFNPAFATINCKRCSLFVHYANSCNVPDFRIIAFIAHHKSDSNILASKHIHPGYNPYMFHGYILNDDGAQVSVVMLRNTGSLQSLITEDCLRKCNYSRLNNFCFVKGITDEIIRTSLVQVNLGSDIAYSNVVGVHNNIPPHFDILLGNDLVNSNSTLCLKDDILVVTRA